MKRHLPKDAGVAVEDAAGSDGTTFWVMFVLLAGAAGGVLWMVRSRFVLDPDSPDFNPIALVPIVLGGFALLYLGRALRWTLQRRRFGAATLTLSGDGVGRLGRRLEGTVRTATTLRPEGDYRIRLRCLESHVMSDTGSSEERGVSTFVAWDSVLAVPAEGVDSARGIPLAFDLPPAVGQPSSRPNRNPNAVRVRMKAAITIPFLKPRFVGHDAGPGMRTWELEVVAPVRGRDFRTTFVFPMEP
jgi:hypothetical protein